MSDAIIIVADNSPPIILSEGAPGPYGPDTSDALATLAASGGAAAVGAATGGTVQQRLNALRTKTEQATDFATGLKIGDPALFAYNLNDIVRIYRDVGTTTAAMHNVEVVTAAKGNNTTYRPVYNAWFEYRDRADVTAGTKNAGYALSLSVAIIQPRNNVPVDDVACLTMGMTGGIATAKGTDCCYISENGIYTAAGNSEWYSLFTAECKHDVSIQIKYRPATGQLIRAPNNCYVYFRNIANSGDVRVLGMNGADRIVLGDTTAARIDLGSPLCKPVSAIVTTATYTVAYNDNYLTFNAPCTVTLPAASSYPGRELRVRSTNGASISASANVVPLAGGSAGTAILSATGKWALLVSDGPVWQIIAAN